MMGPLEFFTILFAVGTSTAAAGALVAAGTAALLGAGWAAQILIGYAGALCGAAIGGILGAMTVEKIDDQRRQNR